MIAKNELILKFINNEIYVINHPVDLRDKFKTKHIRHSFYSLFNRYEYEMFKERSRTLIFYED